jgi:hypothetical protein
MSFGNRASFASLKDAYGILEFSREPEEISYTIKEPTQEVQVMDQIPLVNDDPIIETFDEVTTCESVKRHCSKCNCMKKEYGPIGSWFNELLNIGLILILIYILMYRPSI